MKTRNTLVARAILTLSAAGSILAGSAATVTATAAPSAVVATASSMHPSWYYNG